MKKNLIIILLLVVVIIVIGYGRAQGWLPLQIENKITAPVVEKQVVEDFKVKLEVGDKKYEAKIKPNSTAYDLMKNLQATQGLKFSAKEYAGMGALVEEINGVKNDIKANKFWIFYINGESSPVGVSSYVLKNNDVINWKFEAYKF